MREIKISKKNIVGYIGEDIYEMNAFGEGLESRVFLYKDSDLYNRDVLLKYIRPLKHFVDYGASISLDMMENKRKKIELIEKMDCFKDEIKILDAGYEFGEFRGFTMEKCPYERIDQFEDKRILIRYLKLIRDKIELLNSNNVYIGDFNSTNFLTNKDKNDIKMCDLDNLMIDGIDFDLKHKAIIKYKEKCNLIENIDSYCFNLFTIALLNYYNSGFVIDHLEECPLPDELDNKENRDILDSMINLDNTYKKKYLINNIN